MWGIVGIVAASAIVVGIEVPPLLQQKRKKDLWAVSILLVMALCLSIMKVLKVKLPNPLDWLTVIYKPISDIVFKWLT